MADPRAQSAADLFVAKGVMIGGVSNTGNTLGDTGVSLGTLVLAASGGITASQSTAVGASTVWMSVPAAASGAQLSVYEPYPLISGTAYSSNAPASWVFIPWNQPVSVALSNIVVANSMNASVPAATSANSSGSNVYSYSMGATVFSRQGYAANSTNMSQLTTASFGLTGSLSYSSTAQSFGLTWVTNTTGGTTTFSTSSNAGNWSSYATGPKLISIPCVTTLSQGEYFIAFAHSSTTATSNSNFTLLSMSQLQQNWPVVTVGSLGGSVTAASWDPSGAGCGIASAVTTNNTMALSVVSASVQNMIYFNMSNAT